MNNLIQLKTMDKYKHIDLKMLILYIETIYFMFIVQYCKELNYKELSSLTDFYVIHSDSWEWAILLVWFACCDSLIGGDFFVES